MTEHMQARVLGYCCRLSGLTHASLILIPLRTPSVICHLVGRWWVRGVELGNADEMRADGNPKELIN